MISAQQISDAFAKATQEFAASPDYSALVSGQAGPEGLRGFIGNVFRTHYLSSHIVALCYAVLPSGSAAPLLKENLLEEIGRSETERAHSELLLVLARGAGFSQQEIDSLINDSRLLTDRLEVEIEILKTVETSASET